MPVRTRSGRRGVSLCLSVMGLLLVTPRAALPCTPWAEAVLAWDMTTDVVVVGTWAERAEPPAPGSVPPGFFELRRISTGELLAAHDCQFGPVVPCEYQTALGKAIPAGTTWHHATGAPPRNLRIKHRVGRDRREISLEARGRRGWQRLLWLQVMATNEQERRQYRWSAYDLRDGEAFMAFDVRARGGNCPNNLVRVVRVPQADIVDPDRPGRQIDLLAGPARLDERFEHWRTIAELGPLPPERIMEALEAAEREEQYAFGAKWWNEATKRLPPERLSRLIDSVARSDVLFWTRPLLQPPVRPRSARQ
jgi:hypothetical protein